MQRVPSAKTSFWLWGDENILRSHSASGVLVPWLDPALSTSIQQDAPVPA